MKLFKHFNIYNNVYNDYKLISENKIYELNKAYKERLNKTQVLNFDEDFINKFNKLIECLEYALHYIKNLTNLSNKKENLQLLKEIENNVLNKIEDLKNLYEISDIQNKAASVKDTNYYSNLKNAVFHLLSFLEQLFEIISYENNNKIKTALENIFLDILKDLKNLNSLSFANTLKIFSIFKKY